MLVFYPLTVSNAGRSARASPQSPATGQIDAIAGVPVLEFVLRAVGLSPDPRATRHRSPHPKHSKRKP